MFDKTFKKLSRVCGEAIYFSFQPLSLTKVPEVLTGRKFVLSFWFLNGKKSVEIKQYPADVVTDGGLPFALWTLPGAVSAMLYDQDASVFWSVLERINDSFVHLRTGTVSIEAGPPNILDYDDAPYSRYIDRVTMVNDPSNKDADSNFDVKTFLYDAISTVPVDFVPTNSVAPAISGTAQVGQVLTASNGTWTNSPTAYSYRWSSGGVTISGATSSTYTIQSSDAGKTISVTVTASNSFGSSGASSAQTAAVTNIPVSAPANTVLPTVSGTAQSGQVLTATTGTWSNSPSSYAYQWQRGTTNISGATSSTYTLTASDVGSTVRVIVTATNSGGSTAANSASTGTVAAAPVSAPSNSVAPAISGTAQVGQVLTVNNGSWINSPTGYSYVWRAAGTVISGATASAYTPVSADVGKTITATVTATNAGGSNSASSAATSAVTAAAVAAPVNSVVPTISGTAQAGQTLTATTGTWSGSPTYAYQWQRGSTNISGATTSTYTVVAGDVGLTLKVIVTATNAGGSVSASSANTATVTAAAGANARAWTYSDAGSNIASVHDFSGLAGANGSQINTFPDSSPYGRTLTGVGNTKPTVITNALNGAPVAKVSSANQSYFTFPTSYTSDWTAGGGAIAVIKLDSDQPAADKSSAPFCDFGTGNKSFYPNLWTSGQDFFDSDFGTPASGLFGQSLVNLDLSQWHSMSQRTRAEDRRFSFNSVDQGRNTHDGANSQVAWGANPKLGASPFATSDIAFSSVITTRRFTSNEMWQKIEGKLHHERGLAGLLPAAHPYKSAPPTVSSSDPIANFFAGQKIALEGDSITAQTPGGGGDSWANRLIKHYPELNFQNFGVNGATIAGSNSLASRMSSVLAYGGSAIMIFIGANDLSNTTLYPTVDAWFAALKDKITQYKAGGYSRVAVGTVLPYLNNATHNNRRDAANALIRSDSSIDVVMDFSADPVMGPVTAVEDLKLYRDGLHPSAYGQSLLEDIAEVALYGLLRAPAKGNVSVAVGAKLNFPVRIYGNRSTFTISGADASAFEIVDGPEGAVQWDVKTLRYSGDASATAGAKKVTVTATDEFGRSPTIELTVVAS